MRKDPLITGLYYHIYNRGVDKRDIFMNLNDLKRFALSVKEFNTKDPVGSLDRKINKNNDSLDFNFSTSLVSIVFYCFNPNHFHFILKQDVDGGISEFFKRLLGGYTNYFNLTHKRNGALFQGRFKSKLIQKDDYMLKILPYVHMNYKIHKIPEDKKFLVLSSENEYKNGQFNLVSAKEASEILNFYKGNDNLISECENVIQMIREERGLFSLEDEDLLP